MNKIQVAVLHEAHHNPEGMMMFLAKLTQRGQQIHSLDDVLNLYNECVGKVDWKSAKAVAKLPHGTIKRMTPVTLVIVGASRRFLAQARTHSIGLTWLSGSLQYSDFSDDADFCVPYEVFEEHKKFVDSKKCKTINGKDPLEFFLESSKRDMDDYKATIKAGFTGDTAGYLAPQDLRNVLVVNGNHEALDSFINKRVCHRNTPETQYVAALMLEALYKSTNGDTFFKYSGADCTWGKCREGKMCCGDLLLGEELRLIDNNPGTAVIQRNFPLLANKEDV